VNHEGKSLAKPAETGAWASIRETLKVGIQALLIALVVRTLLFQPFNIPSGSLVPTLLIGDYLFVSKYSYGYSKFSLPLSEYIPIEANGRVWAAQPKRGDIAVFKLPKDNSTDYIKRVIGLPGDKIQMIDGVLNINGQPVKRERIADYETTDAYGQPTKVPQYLETLPNGVVHNVIERDGDNGFWDRTELYTVPAGHFFMMGDNRDNSTASRDLANVFFSIDEGTPAWQVWNWPAHVRWTRLFSTIH